MGVNGLLSAPLLDKLGLTAVDPAKQALKEDVMKQIRTHSKLLFEELTGGTTGGSPSEKSEVVRLCHILEEIDEKHFPSPHHQVERKSSFVSEETKQHAFIAARELFLASLRLGRHREWPHGRHPRSEAVNAAELVRVALFAWRYRVVKMLSAVPRDPRPLRGASHVGRGTRKCGPV